MNIDAALEQIAGWAETDWIGLWEIVAYVEEELGVEDFERQLEVTVAVVKGLLERGLRAGDSPVVNIGPLFVPWRDQDPDSLANLIREKWKRNDEFPSWGDGPWFTVGRLCRLDA
jgi:hypothetical protein